MARNQGARYCERPSPDRTASSCGSWPRAPASPSVPAHVRTLMACRGRRGGRSHAPNRLALSGNGEPLRRIHRDGAGPECTSAAESGGPVVTPEYLTACQETIQQRGKRLVSVFCGLHGVSTGEVRASTAGPIFVTKQVLTPDRQWIKDKVAVRARGGNEGRVGSISSWGGYLFEHPDRPSRVPAHCPGCGSGTIDPGEIKDMESPGSKRAPVISAREVRLPWVRSGLRALGTADRGARPSGWSSRRRSPRSRGDRSSPSPPPTRPRRTSPA